MAENSDAPIALVVDDDMMILMDACDILAEAGFGVREAQDVEEALNHLEELEDQITLLFTDVQMPGARNGFDLAREVAERWPEIGILVASGNLQPKDGDLPERAMFIGKPFSASVIQGRVRELLPDGKLPEPLKES